MEKDITFGAQDCSKIQSKKSRLGLKPFLTLISDMNFSNLQMI